MKTQEAMASRRRVGRPSNAEKALQVQSAEATLTESEREKLGLTRLLKVLSRAMPNNIEDRSLFRYVAYHKTKETCVASGPSAKAALAQAKSQMSLTEASLFVVELGLHGWLFVRYDHLLTMTDALKIGERIQV